MRCDGHAQDEIRSSGPQPNMCRAQPVCAAKSDGHGVLVAGHGGLLLSSMVLSDDWNTIDLQDLQELQDLQKLQDELINQLFLQ